MEIIINLTPEEFERKTKKAIRAKRALMEMVKGEDDNLIDLTHVFEVKLWENNKQAWLKVFDTKHK